MAEQVADDLLIEASQVYESSRFGKPITTSSLEEVREAGVPVNSLRTNDADWRHATLATSNFFFFLDISLKFSQHTVLSISFKCDLEYEKGSYPIIIHF